MILTKTFLTAFNFSPQACRAMDWYYSDLLVFTVVLNISTWNSVAPGRVQAQGASC